VIHPFNGPTTPPMSWDSFPLLSGLGIRGPVILNGIHSITTVGLEALISLSASPIGALANRIRKENMQSYWLQDLNQRYADVPLNRNLGTTTTPIILGRLTTLPPHQRIFSGFSSREHLRLQVVQQRSQKSEAGKRKASLDTLPTLGSGVQVVEVSVLGRNGITVNGTPQPQGATLTLQPGDVLEFPTPVEVGKSQSLNDDSNADPTNRTTPAKGRDPQGADMSPLFRDPLLRLLNGVGGGGATKSSTSKSPTQKQAEVREGSINLLDHQDTVAGRPQGDESLTLTFRGRTGMDSASSDPVAWLTFNQQFAVERTGLSFVQRQFLKKPMLPRYVLRRRSPSPEFSTAARGRSSSVSLPSPFLAVPTTDDPLLAQQDAKGGKKRKRQD
jgi:hypothetical protein